MAVPKNYSTFNEPQAQEIYQRWLAGDQSAMADFMECSKRLIEAIATEKVQRFSDDWDDLCQESYLKLAAILNKKSYAPGRGSLYSFLNRTLGNRMIDMLRSSNYRSSRQCELDLDDENIPAQDAVEPFDGFLAASLATACREWAVHRFSASLRPEVASECAEYVADSIMSDGAARGVTDKHLRRLLTTLRVRYDWDRKFAVHFYTSIKCCIRVHATGNVQHLADALEYKSPSPGCELAPELCLIAGRQQTDLILSVLAGGYIKF